jgi:hypothetical protein
MKRVYLFTTLILIAFATPAQASRVAATGQHMGCQSKDVYNKLEMYYSQGDKEAYRKMFLPAVASGACTIFHNGEEVFLCNSPVFSFLIKLRRPGNTAEYWTSALTIEGEK